MLKNERQPERVMRRLWVKFAEIYGHRWTSSYGEDAGAGAGQTWALGLAGLSPEQIASGILAAMRSGSEWPPSLPLFRLGNSRNRIGHGQRAPGHECLHGASVAWPEPLQCIALAQSAQCARPSLRGR